jgi:hypothetical protein
MRKFSFAPQTFAALLTLAGLPGLAAAAVEDLPGMDTAANMKEWLKLTDAQVAQLKPVIAARIQKTDAALAKVEAAKEPDPIKFLEEYGAIKKEFNAGVAGALTPDQLRQWESFKAELEKDLVASGAKKKAAALRAPLQLTDEQVGRLVPPMTVALQKKLDVLQKLSDGSRISIRDKRQAKKAIEAANDELVKAMSAFLSPNQVAAYQAATKKK